MTAGLELDPHEMLCVPRKRRFLQEYVQNQAGQRELRLYFGLKEISFDEPELFPFGEALIKQERFMAASATTWSSGQAHGWERVKDLLERLLAEGIIEREEVTRTPGESPLHRAFLRSEATRPAPAQPKWWNPDCEQVMQELAGRPLELGWVETVLPVHRVAHAALDGDQRHVGEINVFPEVARMKIPTEWKTCHYAGSRYQDDLPMNVSALTAMSRLWRPLLGATLLGREAFLERYPENRRGWRLGDLHACACAILALPTLLLMRGERPVPNGQLDPVLSSLFRVTDGVRMVAIYLMFLPEQPRTYDHPMDAAELYRLTERDNHFLSTRGVCAGPQSMVEEFLATLVDGRPLAQEAPPPGEWVQDIPKAIDYGLLGLELYSLIFTLWLRMAEAYERVAAVLRGKDGSPEGTLGRLRELLERDWKIIVPSRLHLPVQRAWSEARYVEMFERAQLGQRLSARKEPATLAGELAPARGLLGEEARRALVQLLLTRVERPSEAAAMEAIGGALIDYLRAERAACAAVSRVQRRVNELLQRPQPRRPLAGEDLAIHHRFRVDTLGGLPYLLDMFREELGLSVENTAEATVLKMGERTVKL